MERLEGFQTKADVVYDRLRDAILSGELRPGARINIDALSRSLGISKIPLREAIQRLTGQGLVVQPNPHVGAHVAPLSLREMRGVYLARGAMEGLAARVAATTIGDAELAELSELHERMRFQFERGKLAPMSELNRQFHTGIATATHYATLREMSDLALLRVQHYRIGVRVDPAWGQVITEHAAILDALGRHDPDAAERAARDHVEWQLGVELRAHLDPDLIDLDDDHPSVATKVVEP
ncbi:GntR family transcriptional regulator [Dactylosporangium salmoneum]|uniref:GntR family transcriptional regulator n=1 Tax=Dactylosporangium salmoneum TaxID=53361 RepID=A0ABP5SEW9_9ACTN